ncbi:MAG: OmpA/MotB family protein [Candidatus Binatia bacterium]
MKTTIMDAVRHGVTIRLAAAGSVALLLTGCVFQSTYNTMLAQQQSLEAALRSEISADQVEIEQLKNGIRVRMSSDLVFREGGVELSSAGRAALDKAVPTLNGGSYVIDIVGNTDNVPIGPGLADRYPTNWELAGARAAVVVRHLQAQSVDPTAMQAISAGQYHPVASNDTPQGRAQNRNTEILLRPR